MSVIRATTGMALVAGRKAHVQPAEEEGVFDVWLFLNGKPDDQWVEAFQEAATAADVKLDYNAYGGDPAIAFTEKDGSIMEVIPLAEQIVGRANDRRKQMVEEEKKQLGASHLRGQRAAQIAEEINRQA